MKTLKNNFAFLILALGISFVSMAQTPRSAYDSPSSPSVNAKSKTTTASKKGTTSKKKAGDKNQEDQKDVIPNSSSLPMEVIQDQGEGGLYGVSKPSMRKDNILEDGSMDSTATPLDYTKIFASDAMYRVRVWRTIDARTPHNAKYFYNKAIEGGDDKRLINIILRGIKEEGVQAFSNIDDRFTSPISFDEAVGGFGAGKDTSARYDMEGNISGYQVRNRAVSPDSVFKFRLKEEWLFNKRDGKTYVRILGIAPVTSYTTSDGYTMDNSEHAVFWVYYPDLRKVLVRNNIINPLNMNGYVTWEQVFENRLFESKIIKSSLDAENGFNNSPLTPEQGAIIQSQLNNLNERGWAK